MPYDLYPAVTELYDFPPEIRIALARSLELRNTVVPMTTVLRNNLTAAEKWDGRLIVNTDTDHVERWDAGTSQWYTLVNGNGDTMTGPLKLRDPAGYSRIELDDVGTPQGESHLIFSRNGVQRWLWYAWGAEAGANSGSDIRLISRNDAGATLKTAFDIKRSTGLVNIQGDPITPLGIASKQYADKGGIQISYGYSGYPNPGPWTPLLAQSTTGAWGLPMGSIVSNKFRVTTAGQYRVHLMSVINTSNDGTAFTNNWNIAVTANQDIWIEFARYGLAGVDVSMWKIMPSGIAFNVLYPLNFGTPVSLNAIVQLTQLSQS